MLVLKHSTANEAFWFNLVLYLRSKTVPGAIRCTDVFTIRMTVVAEWSCFYNMVFTALFCVWSLSNVLHSLIFAFDLIIIFGNRWFFD